MHAFPIALVLTCVLHQHADDAPSPDSKHIAESSPRLDVVNYSGRFAEFRIRSSGRERLWRKLRLKDGERDSVAISTEQSYDVQIWYYIGSNRWIVNCQNQIPLGSWFDPDGDARMRHHAVMQWLATPVDGEAGVTHKYEELGETTVPLFAGESITWPIMMNIPRDAPLHNEPGIFRLLGR